MFNVTNHQGNAYKNHNEISSTPVRMTVIKKNTNMGLPCWSRVESSFQCRGCDSVPGQGTKITHAAEQPSLCATTTEPTHSRAHAPQQDRSACLNKDLAQPKLHIYKKRTPITNVLEENPYSLLARM